MYLFLATFNIFELYSLFFVEDLHSHFRIAKKKYAVSFKVDWLLIVDIFQNVSQKLIIA